MNGLVVGPRRSTNDKVFHIIQGREVLASISLSCPHGRVTTQLESSNSMRPFLGTRVESPRHMEEFTVLRLVKKASSSTETWTCCLLRGLDVLGRRCHAL